MRNTDHWRPTKYDIVGGKMRASRDTSKVGLSSRLMVDMIADVYTELIPQYCHGHLLDLGCGHVPMFAFYREFVDQVTCMDWAESMHPNEFLDHVHDLNEPCP